MGVQLIQTGIKCAKCGERFDVDTTPSLEPLPLTWCCDGCGGGGRKPSKYHNVPAEIDGVRFPSQREAKRYADLKLMERAGQIRKLQPQFSFSLVVNGQHICEYVADFMYMRIESGAERGEEMIVEDAKGVRTPEYKLKKKLMKACLGIEIIEV